MELLYKNSRLKEGIGSFFPPNVVGLWKNQLHWMITGKQVDQFLGPGPTLPLLGCDLAVSGVSESHGVRGYEFTIKSTFQWISAFIAVTDQVWFYLCLVLGFISLYFQNYCANLKEKTRALLLKLGTQSPTCLTRRMDAGAPGRFSLARNLNKSYSGEQIRKDDEREEKWEVPRVSRRKAIFTIKGHVSVSCIRTAHVHRDKFCDVVCYL